MEQNTALANVDSWGEVIEDRISFSDEFQEQATAYCSMLADTVEEKAILYQAIANPEKRISDCIGQVINVRHIYLETVNVHQDDGQIVPAPRVVIIDDKGIGYQSVSLGVFRALKKLVAIFGEPQSWDGPLPLVVKQLTTGKNRTFTFDIAKPTASK